MAHRLILTCCRCCRPVQACFLGRISVILSALPCDLDASNCIMAWYSTSCVLLREGNSKSQLTCLSTAKMCASLYGTQRVARPYTKCVCSAPYLQAERHGQLYNCTFTLHANDSVSRSKQCISRDTFSAVLTAHTLPAFMLPATSSCTRTSIF